MGRAGYKDRAAISEPIRLIHEAQQLTHSVHLLSTFANRAWVRGHELGDKWLVLICYPLDLFVSVTKHHMENFEKLMENTVVVD